MAREQPLRSPAAADAVEGPAAQELAVEGGDATLRLARLASFALSLTSARDLDDVAVSLVRHGLPVLGADGCGVVTGGEDGDWHLALASSFDEELRVRFAVEPRDSPLPACRAAREGVPFFLASRAEAHAFHPAMGEVVDLTERPRWALLPLLTGADPVGSLAVSWRSPAPFAVEETALLEAFAAHCAPTLERVLAERAQRRAARAARAMAEELQQRALARVPRADAGGPATAVRYLPAADGAQIGGDWYDAFRREGGGLLLVVGDVTGHDRSAAAAMSQVRTLLRGVGWAAASGGPGRVLDRLDATVSALEPGTLATAVLVEVGPPGEDGARDLRWASAGHVPPLVRWPDGTVQVLQDGSDLLLGVDGATVRAEHRLRLPAGSCLVLYSDGLVEHRAEDLADGIGRLVGALRAGGVDAEAVADALLAAAGVAPPPGTGSTGPGGEDDVTVLVLSTAPGPEEGPVPAEDAGTERAVSTTRVVVLGPGRAAAREARGVVERVCADDAWAEELLDTAVLLVSELVTNAVVHGRSEVRLRVSSGPDRLVVEVGDDNPRAPEALPTDASALSGRGLQMVAAVAADWGWRPRGGGETGKVVWFALDRG